MYSFQCSATQCARNRMFNVHMHAHHREPRTYKEMEVTTYTGEK